MKPLLLALVVVALATPSHAQEPRETKAPKARLKFEIEKVPAKDFRKFNPDSTNILDRNYREKTQRSSSGGGSDGKQGGGDSGLHGSIQHANELIRTRLSLLQAIGNRDWAVESVRDGRSLADIEAMLRKNPMGVIEEMQVRVSEDCQDGRGSQPLVLSADFAQLCVSTGMKPSDYPSLWLSVLAALVGPEWTSGLVFEELDQRLLSSSNELLRRKYNVSMPSAIRAEEANWSCTHYVEEGAPVIVTRPLQQVTGNLSVRRHPDGSLVLRTQEQYEVCVP